MDQGMPAWTLDSSPILEPSASASGIPAKGAVSPVASAPRRMPLGTHFLERTHVLHRGLLIPNWTVKTAGLEMNVTCGQKADSE